MPYFIFFLACFFLSTSLLAFCLFFSVVSQPPFYFKKKKYLSFLSFVVFLFLPVKLIGVSFPVLPSLPSLQGFCPKIAVCVIVCRWKKLGKLRRVKILFFFLHILLLLLLCLQMQLKQCTGNWCMHAHAEYVR